MTTTPADIQIPDYVTMTDTTTITAAVIARHVADLLTEHSDLAAPALFVIHVRSPELELQFPDSPDSFRALASWADRFGGTLRGEPRTDDPGRESVYCTVRFSFQGIEAKLYAYITTKRPAR
jgi:hypothetical protein